MIWLEAVEQAQAIGRRETSSLDLVREYLDRIDRLDPDLRSYVTVDATGALKAAEAADRQVVEDSSAVGPLHGIPVSVKDVIDVAGLPTTHSSKALVDNVSSTDDPLVRRFRQAGLVIIGKTNVPEFCTTMTSSDLNGVCRNPWDPERTPGGSSGGAAAAVAAGLCSIAHGTDGAGSTRVPAAFCGLVGLKPTRGLVSFGPEQGKSYFGTSEPGVIARSVQDAAAMLDVMVGTGDALSAWSPRPADSYLEQAVAECGQLRIAVTTSPPFGSVESECADAVVRVGAVLESLGHLVMSGTPDWGVILQAALIPAEVPGAAGLVNPEHYELLEPRNRPIAKRLAALTVAEHAQMVDLTRRSSTEFLTFWEDLDILVSPTAGMLPPSVSWAPWEQTTAEHMATFETFPNFAQPFNLSGQPALSLPLAWSSSGLPIGVQLAGRRFSEADLLRLAAQLEAALPWSSHHPGPPIGGT
jgi:amidase